jgi:hypothetical protein
MAVTVYKSNENICLEHLKFVFKSIVKIPTNCVSNIVTMLTETNVASVKTCYLIGMYYWLNWLINVHAQIARSETWALSSLTAYRGFVSRLSHAHLSLFSLYVIVLCRYRPCDELITRPGVPTVCGKLTSERKGEGIINGGPGPLLDCRAKQEDMPRCRSLIRVIALLYMYRDRSPFRIKINIHA